MLEPAQYDYHFRNTTPATGGKLSVFFNTHQCGIIEFAIGFSTVPFHLVLAASRGEIVRNFHHLLALHLALQAFVNL
jgi:hypothetical protein